MGWVKLDDGYFHNRKFARLGLATDPAVQRARLLHLASTCWCAEQLTDGAIPAGALPIVTLLAGVPAETVKDLVDVELWHEPGHDCPECPAIEEGWYVHGYLERNRTAESEERRKRAEREKKARQRARGAGAVEHGPGGRFVSRSPSRGDRGRDNPGDGPRRSRRPSPATRSRTPDPKGPGGTSSSQEVVEEEDGRLCIAAETIAERRLQRRSPSKDPVLDRAKYLRTVADERLAEHRAAALAYLEEHPDATALELADELEPDLVPPPGPWTACGKDGCVDGFVELDQDGHLVIERCACNPARRDR